MFTRSSNFSYGNYHIANILKESQVSTEFLIQIQKYETEGLKLLLGSTLYSEFISKLELVDYFWSVKSGMDAKWSNLLNGCNYPNPLDANQTKTWRGIVNKVAKIGNLDVIESILAPYIFYYYSLNTRTLNFGTGEGKLKTDNTTQESNKNKRIDAWNEFVQWSTIGFSNTDVSLFQFLNDHKDIFNFDCFVELNIMTYYDI